MVLKEKTSENLGNHYKDALCAYPKNQIVGVFLQGSQNYGIETSASDVDSKCILIPTFDSIVLNQKPISTTFIRENEEHIDYKDIRKYFECFRRQNMNFVETLFTMYKYVNADYEAEWNRLVEKRELIAHYCPTRAVKAMYGVALQKFHALKHLYPSKVKIIEEKGYDPKQLSHLFRIEDFMERYINGVSYEDCLSPTNSEYLINVKLGICHYDKEIDEIAVEALEHCNEMQSQFCRHNPFSYEKEVDDLLNDVLYNIIKKKIKEDFKDKEN